MLNPWGILRVLLNAFKTQVRLAAVAMSVALPWIARGDALDAINRARMKECPASSLRTPLTSSRSLNMAAAGFAAGQSLHAALVSAAYVSVQSTAIHVTGAVDDRNVGRLLAAHDCAELADPTFKEVGVVQRARELWIVLAAPAPLPSAADARVIGRQILALVNDARAAGRRCGRKNFSAAPPVTLSAPLTAAALEHSQDMALTGHFDHQGRDGSSPSDRVARARFGGVSVVGENIAAGALTPTDVTQGWLDSPPHCENIMDPRFSEMGVGFTVNRASPELIYWTQDFARPHAAIVR